MSRISIIIPTLNEAETLPLTFEPLRKELNREVIIVDGGSQDKTVNIAQEFGAKIIQSPVQNRAYQMNLGAEQALGSILLFLHADTRLPSGYAEKIITALSIPKTVAGAFALGIDGEKTSFRLIEKTVNWRSRFLSLPYGDQAIFLPTKLFREMGGFVNMPIMEDFNLIQRLKRRGNIHLIPDKVITSNRRWQKLGVYRTTLTNQCIVLGYYFGISPEMLASWYGRKSQKTQEKVIF